MPKGTEAGVFTNVTETAYVWGEQDGIFGRWPVTTVGDSGTGRVVDTGPQGPAGQNGSPGAVVAFYMQQIFGGF